MSTASILAAIAVMAGVTFFTRVFPFLFFGGRRNPPMFLQFIQRYIPPMIMVILVVYALSDVVWLKPPHGIPEVLCILVAGGLHVWKKNALVSIFSATILYMVLVQTGAVEKVLELL